MWKRITDRITESDEVAGIEVHISKDGAYVKSISILKQKNKKVLFAERKQDIKLEELSAHLPSSLPLHLVITGKGILIRKFIYTENEEAGSVLNKVLPNSAKEDFYLQQFSPDMNNQAFVAVSRINIIADIISAFQNQGYYVLSVVLGPFSILPVLPLINDPGKNAALELSSHKIITNNNFIEDIQPSTNISPGHQFKIEEEIIEDHHLLSFSSALNAFIKYPMFKLSTLESLTAKSVTEFKSRKAFKTTGVSLLIFFFSMLLINYFLFDHYSKKRESLSGEMLLKQDQLAKVNVLKKQYDEKKAFFEAAGLLNKSKTSFYADQLAKDLPSTMQFTSLNFNPVIKSTDEEENINFKSRSIIVNGLCKKSFDLNQWIKILKKKSWLKKVTLLNYQQESAQPGEFLIELETFE